MRKRKGHAEDHVNHEAWAIPYADLMTLLLAFFVVMYAVSVVNEGKYRVMSASILQAFHGTGTPAGALPPQAESPPAAPVPAAAPARRGATTPIVLPLPGSAASGHARAGARAGAPAGAVRPDRGNLHRIGDQVTHALQPLIARRQVVVRQGDTRLEIELRTDILFPSAVAQLSTPAETVLTRLAGILSPFDNPVRVEGYTDDQPISTAQFPSNWELSAARAASVARLFAGHGVDPGRLGIIGWGQFRPAADNATAEGRNRNRRVLVVVLGHGATPERYAEDAATVVAGPARAVADREPAPALARAAHGAAAPAASHTTIPERSR